MKTLLLKKILYVGCYLVAAIIIELITFNVISIGVFPTYAWLDIAIMFFLAAIVFVIPNFIAQAIVICVLLTLQALLSVVNEALYSMSNMVFSLNMLNLLNEVGGVFNNDFVNYLLGGALLAIVAGVGVVFWFSRNIRTKHTFKFQVIILLLAVFIATAGDASVVYLITVNSFTTATESDELYIYKDDAYLYDTQFISTKAYKKFGTYGYYFKNFDIFMNSVATNDDDDSLNSALDSISDYFSEGKYSSELENLNLTAYGGNDNIMTGKLNGQNVVLIVMESGEWFSINNEYTPTLYALATNGISMTEYYARDKTNHSEALSVLGSYPSQTDNTITPSISNPNGLLKSSFDFSLPNILQENGYTTNYFHANDGDFYGRADTFSELYGFDYSYLLDDMQRLKGYYKKNNFYDFDKDSEVISQYLSEYTKTDENDDTFYTMMMTLISHGNYDDLLNFGDYTATLSDKEKETYTKKCVVKGLEDYYIRINEYPQTFLNDKFKINVSKTDEKGDLTTTYLRYKRYQAGVMDLDVGLNRLIAELSKNDQLKDTAFIIYADHNCYYNKQNYFLKEINEAAYWNTELYNVPFIIWSGNCMNLNVQSDLYENLEYTNTDANVNSVYEGRYYNDIAYNVNDSIGGIQITKYCNSFDVLPTILDLLGFDYNLNLYHGVSVFKNAESIFISRESGMFNANIFFDGNYIYVKTQSNETTNSAMYSFDKQICFKGNNISIQTDDGIIELNAEKVKEYIYLDDICGYIVYNLNEILDEPEENIGAIDYRIYLSVGVKDFLQQTNNYYKKQEILEKMYKYDYFKDNSIDDLVFKI